MYFRIVRVRYRILLLNGVVLGGKWVRGLVRSHGMLLLEELDLVLCQVVRLNAVPVSIVLCLAHFQELVGEVRQRSLVLILNRSEVVRVGRQSGRVRSKALKGWLVAIHHELLKLVGWEAVAVLVVRAEPRLLGPLRGVLLALRDLEFLVAVEAGSFAVLP